MSSLPDYISERLDVPFKWGQSDCFCLTMGWSSLITGRDLFAGLAPWKSQREARRRMRQIGGLNHFFDTHFAKIDPNFAVDGDITLIDTTSFLFVGRHIVSVGDGGLIFQSRTKATCAWRCA